MRLEPLLFHFSEHLGHLSVIRVKNLLLEGQPSTVQYINT